MGVAIEGAEPEHAGETLADAVIRLMKRTGMPNGLSGVGYGPDDVDDLVKGTLSQQRLTKLSPRPSTEDDLRSLFVDPMVLW